MKFLSAAELTLLDDTNNNATPSAHGFLPKLSNNSTQYLNGQGNWVLPSGLVSTATAAGTTTLTVNSLPNQRFTGSTTQTIVMPVVTTLSVGWVTDIINDSTGTLTVNSSGGNLITTVVAGDRVTLNCVSIAADTTAAAWTVTKVSKSSGTSGGISLGTAIATTSGTSHTFTGIPAGVKRITVMFNGVSTNGTSLIQIQAGSGSVTTSGYVSTGTIYGGSNTTTGSSITTGLPVSAPSASDSTSGVGVLILVSNNTWVWSSNVNKSSGNYLYAAAGNISLSGTLDRIRLTTVNGTDLFDAGSVNISWEF